DRSRTEARCHQDSRTRSVGPPASADVVFNEFEGDGKGGGMKLVLSVSAIGEQAEGRCPWMWIDLSAPLAQKALERIDVFRFAEEKDDDAIELYYVSPEATFFNPWLAAPETKQEEGRIAIEDLLEQLCADDRDWAEGPDALTIPER